MLKYHETSNLRVEQVTTFPNEQIFDYLPTKDDYDGYVEKISSLEGVGIFAALLPTYPEYVDTLASNLMTHSCLVVTNAYLKGTNDLVGHSILHDIQTRVDPARVAKFDLFGDSFFDIPLPPVLPEFFNELLDVLPSCMIANYLPIYPKEYGYQDDKSFGLYVPSDMDSYVASLSRKNRQHYNAVMRMHPDVRVDVVGWDKVKSDPDFIQGYLENLERWTREDDCSGNIAHINNMLRILDPSQALVLQIFAASGQLLCTNIGEVRGRVYVDKIAVPSVSYDEYKRTKLGFLAIYEAIRHLAGSGRADYYHLDTGGDYKEKFIPQGFELPIQPLDYTSVNEAFLTGPYPHQFGFYPPAHIKGKGWHLESIPDYPFAEDFYVEEVSLSEFLKQSDDLFRGLDKGDGVSLAFIDSAIEAKSDGANLRIIVAKWSHKNPIGFVAITQFDTAAYVDLVYVPNHLRGKGIARRMMAKVLDVLGKDCKEVGLHTSVGNTAAVRLYDSLGFSRSASIIGYYGTDGADEPGESFGTDRAYYYYLSLETQE